MTGFETFLCFYGLGVLLSMHMFFHMDKQSREDGEKHTFGFVYSLFLSTLLGIVVGYVYFIVSIISFIELNVWREGEK